MVKSSIILYALGRSLQIVGMVLVLYVAIFFYTEPNMWVVLKILIRAMAFFVAGWLIVSKPWLAK